SSTTSPTATSSAPGCAPPSSARATFSCAASTGCCTGHGATWPRVWCCVCPPATRTTSRARARGSRPPICTPRRRRARRGAASALALERDRDSAYVLSLGGRVDLWRDTVFGFVDVILPLNRDGFRSDVIPLLGVEAAF